MVGLCLLQSYLLGVLPDFKGLADVSAASASGLDPCRESFDESGEIGKPYELCGETSEQGEIAVSMVNTRPDDVLGHCCCCCCSRVVPGAAPRGVSLKEDMAAQHAASRGRER